MEKSTSLDAEDALIRKGSLFEYSGLSPRVEKLLGSQEGRTLDFKESISGLSNEDIVAFANSESGGTILLGVREGKDGNGLQAAEIIGCEVGDKPKLSILGKAASCVPPVEVYVVIENSEGRKPFIRIEIPSGQQKPYCTSGGTYKIRGDARNEPLTPSRLLEMFMEAENDRFINRFSQATVDLEQSIKDVKTRLLSEMEDICSHVDELRDSIKEDSSAF